VNWEVDVAHKGLSRKLVNMPPLEITTNDVQVTQTTQFLQKDWGAAYKILGYPPDSGATLLTAKLQVEFPRKKKKSQNTECT